MADTRRGPRRSAAAIAFLVIAASAGAACGDDDGPRRGGAGESCRATDDCETPLVCRANVCTDPSAPPPDAGMDAAERDLGPEPDLGPPDSGPDAGPDAPDTGPADAGPATDGGPISACDECLDTECAAQEAECDSECIAIEACIQMVCGNLSVTGSADEGMCQVTCQNAHLSARSRHLDLVNCVVDSSCPSCGFFPEAFIACRETMARTACAGALAACDASTPCAEYRNCVSQCTTLSECNGCDDDNFEGRMILESYEQCLAAECVAEAWVP